MGMALIVVLSDWRAVLDETDGGRLVKWTCKLCGDGNLHLVTNIERHERGIMHSAISAKQNDEEMAVGAGAQTSSTPQELTFGMNLVDSGTKNLLQSLAGVKPTAPSPPTSPSDDFLHNPITDWGVFAATENTYLNRSQEDEGIALLAQSLLDRLDDLSIDGSSGERSDEDDTPVYGDTPPGQSTLLGSISSN